MTAGTNTTVPVTHPAVSIVKTASAATVTTGTQVTYSYVVKNTGDVAINNIQVKDNKLGLIGSPFNLAAGATAPTLTKVTTLTATTTNSATATGTDTCASCSVSSPVSTVTVTVVNPALTIVKSADLSCVLKGGSVTYTYTVKNTGDVKINNLLVTDDQLGVVGMLPSLAVGATTSFTRTTALAVTTTNTAAASGTAAVGGSQLLVPSNAVTVTVVNPSLTLVKTANTAAVVAGTQVTYSYEVTNTGDVAINGIQVTDDQLGVIGSPFNLAAGATSSTLMKSATLSSTTTNVATASGKDACANSTVAALPSSITVTVVNPFLSILKTADHDCVVKDGPVTYTYTVKNTGDVAIANLLVTDDKLGPVGALTSLAAGVTTTFTKATTLSETTTNTAAVSGTDATVGSPVLAPSNSVTVTVVNPSIQISEVASDSVVPYGGPVTFTYLVKNIGDVPLSGVVVSSSLNGGPTTTVGSVSFLAPGESKQFSREVTPVLTSLTDVATVTSVGGCAEGQAISASAPDVDVTLVPAGWTGKVVCGACGATPNCGIASAKVQVYRASDDQPVGSPIPTGTDGSFTIDPDLTDGQYYLKVSAPDYFVTTTAVQLWAQAGPDLTTFVPMTALPVTFQSVELAKGQIFFSDRDAWKVLSKGTLIGPNVPVGLDAPAATLGQLTNGSFNSAGFTKAYRYFGYIPGYPELGLFDANRPVYLMMNSPLVAADGWNPASPDTVSFRNSVYVQDGTQLTGTPQANPGRASQPYFIRILFSHPFDAVGTDATPRGSAYNYNLWLDLGSNLGISGVAQQTHIEPGIISLVNGAAFPALTATPWTSDAGPATNTPGVVPPGWMVQSMFQFRQAPGQSLSAFYARGTFKNACGETPTTSPFAIHPDVEPSPDL